jgi:hypothetical protein
MCLEKRRKRGYEDRRQVRVEKGERISRKDTDRIGQGKKDKKIGGDRRDAGMGLGGRIRG